MHKRDTCIDSLNRIFDQETMEECDRFIRKKRESRHFKTLRCQNLKDCGRKIQVTTQTHNMADLTAQTSHLQIYHLIWTLVQQLQLLQLIHQIQDLD